ncbi:sulfotransferase domain-containing protein [Paenarthrobacter sp. Z7-10]|uniref:sulfotransferase family protein n=1 Tax=Paenarthrobacter sp. Z7-10 TaxID=2787635 RepID=UPI002E795E79|nr:sulfotransferase [Paenarthrobacter sp. Z7-10]MCZ2402936.1 sulfotransferase domain-containing protein [Paenarthrobacter sp. Z7-10]
MAVEATGTATSGLRMLPSLIIIGAQRSGTTTLYRMLSEHPSVIRPTASKGVGYFDLNYHRGLRWYRGHFPLKALTAGGSAPDSRITFESSGYYSHHPLAVPRLAEDLPGVKLLMMLRDPVDRAYSAHRHEYNRGFETESFERALELEPERLHGEVEKMQADPAYQSFAHRHHAYLGRSRYWEQVSKIHEAVGKDRLYLVDADRFFARPHEEFEEIQRWLGLPRWQPEKVMAWNAQPREPMEPQLRERLMSYFEPYDQQLAEAASIPLSWRR